MQFQLPSNLHQQIRAYDPQAKKAQAAPAGASRNHLGLPTSLIPTDLVPADVQAGWVSTINNSAASGRFLSHNTADCKVIVAHSKGVWQAVWILEPTHPRYGQFYYGFSITHKDTPATNAKAENYLGLPGGRHLRDAVKPVPMVNGRSKLVQYLAEVDLTTLRKLAVDNVYPPVFRHDKFWFRQEVVAIGKSLKERHTPSQTGYFPGWAELAMVGGDVRRAAFPDHFRCNPLDEDSTFHDLLLAKTPPKHVSLLREPFFRQSAQELHQQCQQKLQDLPTYCERLIQEWLKKLGWVHFLEVCYGPKVNRDLLYRLWVCHIEPPTPQTASRVSAWVGKNVPAASLVRMAESDTGAGRLFNDTLGMLRDILHLDPECQVRPKRWRLREWHDLLSTEKFKISTPNEVLPQDLFPQPIKAGGFTFLQPRDTHQLAQWGQAVRNCVGSSSSYAAGVKKRRHFIVLAMRGSEPCFTVQLQVEGGMMTVKQIVKTCNKPLSATEQQEYSQAFSAALQIRDSQT